MAPAGANPTRNLQILIYGQALICIIGNLFVFVVSWFPASLQSTLHTTTNVVPSLVGPLVAMSCYAAGAVLWLWEFYIAPALGYKVEVLQETREGLNVHMTFNVSILHCHPKADPLTVA